MKTKTKQLLSFALLFCLLALGGYIYLFSVMKRINVAVASSSRDLAYELERESRLKSVEVIVRDTVEKREALASYFVSEDAVVDTITQLENIADVTGAEVTVSSVTREEGQVGRLMIAIQIKGGWDTMMSALTLMQHFPLALQINSAALTKNNDLSWSGRVALTILTQ